MQLQAQANTMELTSYKDLTITSTSDEVVISSPKKITLMAGGSYLTLEPAKIEHGTEGDFLVKSASLRQLPPASMSPDLPELPTYYDQQVRLTNENTGEPIEGASYRLVTSGGKEFFGVTDKDGRTIRVNTVAQEQVEVFWNVKPDNLKKG